jgi:DNA repair protein RadC
MPSLVRELRVTCTPQTAGPLLPLGRPADAVAILRARLETEPVEVCLVLLVNTKHRLLGVHEVGRGTLDCCIVHPRDVFKVALLANAAGVIVGHNHPSGEPEPSPDDMALCTRLRHAGSIVGIDLLDFIIVAGRRYYSCKECGR